MRWLLLSLVLAVGVVQSQEPPKAKAAQEKVSTEQRATEKTPHFVTTSGPTNQAERDHEAYEKQRKLWNETALAYATIALAWITLFLALFTGRPLDGDAHARQ